MAVFTLEMDYQSETGYLLDNSHHIDNTYILILDGGICPTLSICSSLNFDGFCRWIIRLMWIIPL